MPQSTDLMGHGEAWPLAALLGNDPVTVAATGSVSASAAAVILEPSHCVNVTGANGNNGVIFPSSAKIGTPYYVFNAGTSTLLVYPPSTQAMNGTTNGTATIAASSGNIFVQYSLNNWAKF